MVSEPDELVELPLTLQLRPEGEFWVARLVHTGAKRMVDRKPFVVATIRLSIIKKYNRHRLAFLRTVEEIGSDLIEEVTGQRPVFELEERDE